MREFASPCSPASGSGSGCGYCVGKPWTLPSALMPVVIVAPGHRGPVAVVHGRGVDAVFVFPAQALSGPLSALIVWAASAPSSSSSSATTTGGSSWSCVHSPLKLLRKMLQNFTDLKGRTSRTRFTAIGRSSARPYTQSDLRSCGLRLDTLWNEPQLLKQPLFANENLYSLTSNRFSVLSDP